MIITQTKKKREELRGRWCKLSKSLHSACLGLFFINISLKKFQTGRLLFYLICIFIKNNR